MFSKHEMYLPCYTRAESSKEYEEKVVVEWSNDFV